jgi:hypothetical protein
MTVRKHIPALLLAAALGWAGAPAGAASASESNRPEPNHVPASSRCMAECEAMEIRCEELEKEFPTCGTADICLEEKEQCQALCRTTAMVTLRSCS